MHRIDRPNSPSRLTTVTAALFLAGLILAHAAAAPAALIEYAFSGTIDESLDGTPFEGLTGLPFAGRVVYDTALAESPDTLGDAEFARYEPPLGTFQLGLEVEIGTAAVVVLTEEQIVYEVLNESSFLGDEFFAGGTLIEGATPADDISFSLELLDPSGTAFASTQLPPSLVLSDFETARIFSPYFGNGSFETGLLGTIDRLVLVPEPGTSLLLGLGLAGLSARRARFSRLG